ncbi:MAG: hypothetical protein RL071_4810 [Pseudomonadota bacterium]|jgi:hypothetical protein
MVNEPSTPSPAEPNVTGAIFTDTQNPPQGAAPPAGAEGAPTDGAEAPWAGPIHDKLIELRGARLQLKEGVTEHKVRQLHISVELGALLAAVEANKVPDAEVMATLARRGARVDRVSLSRHRTLNALNQRHPLTTLPRFGYADALNLLRIQDEAVLAAVYQRVAAEPGLRATRLTKEIAALRTAEPDGGAAPLRGRHLGTARRQLLGAASRLSEALQAARDELQRAAHEADAGGDRGRRWREERAALEKAIIDAMDAIQQQLARPTSQPDTAADS